MRSGARALGPSATLAPPIAVMPTRRGLIRGTRTACQSAIPARRPDARARATPSPEKFAGLATYKETPRPAKPSTPGDCRVRPRRRGSDDWRAARSGRSSVRSKAKSTPDHLLWGSILPTRARLCWLCVVCVGWQGREATSASFGGLDGLSFNDRPQPGSTAPMPHASPLPADPADRSPSRRTAPACE